MRANRISSVAEEVFGRIDDVGEDTSFIAGLGDGSNSSLSERRIEFVFPAREQIHIFSEDLFELENDPTDLRRVGGNYDYVSVVMLVSTRARSF
jgi:hypothetical protein